MGIGVDLVRISRVAENSIRSHSISGVIEDIFEESIQGDPYNVARWIAINEAVFKSLDPKSQLLFRGVDSSHCINGWFEVKSADIRKFMLRRPRTKVSISYCEDFLIAVAMTQFKLTLIDFRRIRRG